MSFLDWPSEPRGQTTLTKSRRKAITLRLIRAFADVYPNIEYDLLWQSATINAQAWRDGDARRVRIYGGLARHPALNTSGIALALAHETGHHLAGPPMDPDLPWLTWQGQADYWAAKEAMPKVFGRTARRITLIGARELLRLHQELRGQEIEFDLSAQLRFEIFRAGAAAEGAPSWLELEYKRLLK